MTKKLLISISTFKLISEGKNGNFEISQSSNIKQTNLRKNLQDALHLDSTHNLDQTGKLNSKIVERKRVIVDQMISLENKIRLLR